MHIGTADCLFLLFFPLIQIGNGVWLSCATLASVLFVWRWGKVTWAGLKDLPAFLFIVPLMFFPYLINETNDANHDLLVIARQALFFVLEISFFNGARLFHFTLEEKFLSRLIFWISIFLISTTAFQFVMLKRGIYVGIPVEYFAQGQNTVPDELDLRYSDIRPSSTFTEPSYMAFILLCLMVMNRTFHEFLGKSRTTTTLLIIAGLLTQSFSFVMFTGALFMAAVYYMSSYARHRNAIFVVSAIGLLIIALFGSNLFFAERLSAAGSASGDISTFVRIFGPGAILPEYLLSHPAGALESGIRDIITPYTSIYGQDPDQFLMNSVFNQFFYYGLFGIGILYFCLRGLDLIFILFIFMSFMFNGNVFAPDKFFCFCLTYLIHRHNMLYHVSHIDGGGAPNRHINQAKTEIYA